MESEIHAGCTTVVSRLAFLFFATTASLNLGFDDVTGSDVTEVKFAAGDTTSATGGQYSTRVLNGRADNAGFTKCGDNVGPWS